MEEGKKSWSSEQNRRKSALLTVGGTGGDSSNGQGWEKGGILFRERHKSAESCGGEGAEE